MAIDVQRQIVALGLAEHIELPGACDDPSVHLARGHMVTLTSDHEGIPNALLEGMAMGRPVVAPRVGGIPELVDDGCGITVPPNDEGALANAILALIQDKDRRSDLGAAARRKAEGFSWDAVVQRTESIYRTEVARNSTSSLESV
jgi:glycosyltransferase involved in cell wall biosynthesis